MMTFTKVRGTEVSQKYYRRYNNLVRAFKEANGCTTCRDICAPFMEKKWGRRY